jgi:uncharacterized protein DUF6916
MSISRRKFVKTASVVAIAAGIPLKVFASDSAVAASPTLSGLGSATLRSSLDSATFSKYVNTQFTLKRGLKEVKITLVEVRHWGSPDAKKLATGRECFSLIFKGAEKDRLAQDGYMALHAALGEFPLFIVPAGRTQQKYEAVFNRLHG